MADSNGCHVVWEPSFVCFFQVCNGYGENTLNCQIRAACCSDPLDLDACIDNVFQNRIEPVRADGDNVAALVFAKEGRMCRSVDLDACANSAGHGHFRESHAEAAGGNVMDAGEARCADQLAHKGAAPFFSRQINRWRSAFFAAEDVRKILRGAKMCAAAPDDENDVAFIGKRRTGAHGHIRQQANTANCRGRQDRFAVGLIVKRHVARDDREVEFPAGFADAFDAADELAHDFRAFRIAEVEVVGRRERL
jgi:hypothetical protein